MAERITITIDTGNDAFTPGFGGEVASILRDLSTVFARHGIPPSKLRDSNGNTCGTVAITWQEGE